MPSFEITYRDLTLPEEPERSERVEAEDQAQAMAIAKTHLRQDEQVVGLAPVD